MTQDQALTIMQMGHNVFLTGAPGAGKTFVLNKFISHLKEHNINVGITASTGVAATHINGMTIHSFAGIGIKDELAEAEIKKMMTNPKLQKRLVNLSVLIIDEVSMLDGKRLDLLDAVFRVFRGNDRAFGGVQVVLTGDLFQLPPVTKFADRANVDFVFKSKSWKKLDLKICYLAEQHRQDDDQLLNILHAIRKGTASYPELDTLQTRQIDDQDTEATRLFTHNVDVDAINERKLSELRHEEVVLESVATGQKAAVDAIKQTCLAPELLVLKVGAEVMCVANNQQGKFVNGSRATVIDFEPITNAPIIKLHDNGKVLKLERHTWSIDDGDRSIAEVAQYPLRLAWAITIHKSQGMSLDEAEVDLGRSFEPGMGYVALSRLRTLEGLLLRGINEMALKVHPEVSKLDEELQRKSTQLVKALGELDQEKIASNIKKVKNALSTETFQYNESLFKKLQSWRKEMSEENKTPAYIVFDDKTLKLIAAKKPSDLAELSAIKGIGPTKLEKYGSSILEIIK